MFLFWIFIILLSFIKQKFWILKNIPKHSIDIMIIAIANPTPGQARDLFGPASNEPRIYKKRKVHQNLLNTSIWF